MQIDDSRLRIAVLDVVAKDFEWFDSIYEKLVTRHGFIREGGLHKALAAILFSMASESRIEAFRMHAEPPYFTPTSLEPSLVENCWFCVGLPHWISNSEDAPASVYGRTGAA